VAAGAGTGKTWTMACRVAHLLESGVPPERILLLTFTRRAAREMLARAARLTGRSSVGRVWGGTFHAVANRLLRQHGGPVGVRPDFTVLDQTDAADLMNLIRSDLGLAERTRRFPRKDVLAAIYSRVVNSGLPLGRVLEEGFPWCSDDAEDVASMFRAYTERKRGQNVLDFDDLLLFWRALATAPQTGSRVAESFRHILVDEYQDTNGLQAEILTAMRHDSSDITVVGDDDQSIYGFRAATVRNILDFPDAFPGTRVVTLEENYRSTQAVLDASNAAIALAPRRHPKVLRSVRGSGRRPELLTCLDEPAQSDAVCRAVLEHRERGVPLRRQAVLFRAVHHSDQLEVELARRNIPFVRYGGLRFLESAHVKDALACLRVLENPLDEVSWFRVLQLLEGVGPRIAERMMAALGVRGSDAPPGPLRTLIERGGSIGAPPEAAADLDRLRAAVEDCAGRAGEASLPARAQLERISRFLAPIIVRRMSSPAARLADLRQLEAIAGAAASRSRFLADLILDPPASTGDLAGPPLLDDDWLVLSTIHSAKGGEWDVVHLIHVADGMIPSDMATGRPEEIEEERRLLYVAMTRARDALHVYVPLRYYRRPKGLQDEHAWSQVSRFLTTEVRQHFDERSPMPADDWQRPRSRRGRSDAPATVAAFLDDLWRT
jgi:DNA helicase-2/ATP-dependent DNA helicase PcrA